MIKYSSEELSKMNKQQLSLILSSYCLGLKGPKNDFITLIIRYQNKKLN